MIENPVIVEALALRREDVDADWGTTLRVHLDAAGVSDVERVKAMRTLLGDARELLACTSLDGDAALNAEEVAAALDSMLQAGDYLAVALEELARDDQRSASGR